MAALNKKRLVLIDGHALAYRMFFALPIAGFSTRGGEPTNATFGFTRTLLELVNAPTPPDYLAVMFDKGGSFRDEMYSEYKGTREKMPNELQIQIDRIHDVLEALDIPIYEMEGYEADDLLGTVGRMSESLGILTLIVTGDRDLLQLVDEHVSVQLPGSRANDKPQVYTHEEVAARFGLTPGQIVDLKALMGDSSDNIPGVPGIGEKTAVQLLQTYTDLDSIYQNLDLVAPKRAKTALEAGRDSAYLSYQLAKIVTDVPFGFDLDACQLKHGDHTRAFDLFRELEFRSLIEMLGDRAKETTAEGQQLMLFGGSGEAKEAIRANAPQTITHVIHEEEDLVELAKKLESASAIAFDTETTSTDQMTAKLVGISLAIEPGEAFYIPVGHRVGDENQIPLETVVRQLEAPLINPGIPKYGHNISYDTAIMRRHGINVNPLSFDSMLGAWLLQPAGSRGKLGLKWLALMELGVEMTEIDELLGKGKSQITMDLVEIGRVAPYAGADADMTLQLVERIKAGLEQEKLDRLFYDIEMPLVPVLVSMEMAGVLVDIGKLQKMSAEMGQVLETLTTEVYNLIGFEFNINSSQQLSDVLFKQLGLPTEGLKKTRSGHYSTAADVLDDLRPHDKSGVIDRLLQLRELTKLRSTYLDALPGLVNPVTGRIHTSFNQTGAATGRLSSSDPNLQNIPIRTEQGRRIRDAFVAAPGNRLIAADYSQVELRVLAHISGDDGLRNAFQEGKDIHASTAATVYEVPLDKVTIEQRSFAKRVNFGLIYGMGAARLARDAGMSRADANAFVDTYFARFPRIQEYLEKTKKQAAELGYVETLLGRKRYFPQLDPTSKVNEQDRRAAERVAINMPIQGTAADIIKIAMIRLYNTLQERHSQAQILIQVHDELVLEAPESEAEEVAVLVQQTMETAYPLDVPLRVDVHIGANWGELK